MTRHPTACAALVALALAGARAPAQTFDPESCELALGPGQTEQVAIEVCVPGEEVGAADIYLLADNTQSMGPVIDAVKANATALVSSLLSRPDVDIRIAVGNYDDVPPVTESPFHHQQDVTDDQGLVVAAIDEWTNTGGGDVSESQLYALHRIAVDGTLGFRPEAKRIVVWFGDSPAHDPICAPIVGLFEDPAVEIDEETVIAELQGAGLDGTTVIAISTPFGQLVPDGLNNDPIGPDRGFVVDYEEILQCPQDGVAGQADRIAGGTAGISTDITDPAEITDAILDTIDSVLTEASVTLTPVGEIVNFVASIAPDPLVLTLPPTMAELACGEVLVTFEGPPCEENQEQTVFTGGIEVRVDGELVGTKDVEIEHLCTESVCLMYGGLQAAVVPLSGSGDALYTVPVASWPVLLDEVPSFAIPNDAGIAGTHVFLQVAMNNPFDFPEDPVKTSNGLDVTLGEGARAYGAASGMELFLTGPPALGGTLAPAFTIDGL